MISRSFWICLLALGGVARANAAPAIEMPVEVHGTHVYVRASVEKTADLWFLLDSGAATPVNLIDAQAAARIGLKGGEAKTGDAIGGQVTVKLTAPATMAVGDVALPTAPLAMMTLSEMAAEEGHRVDGILGYAFFSLFNPEIDYKNGRMRLTQTPSSSAQDGVAMRVVAKTVRVNAEIVATDGAAPLPVVLVVDTGFDGSLVLNRPFVEQHHLQTLEGSASGGASAGGETGGKNVRIAALRIGAVSEAAVATRLSDDTKGAFAASDVDGYLGGGVLRSYRVLFDYKNGRFVLKRP